MGEFSKESAIPNFEFTFVISYLFPLGLVNLLKPEVNSLL